MRSVKEEKMKFEEKYEYGGWTNCLKLSNNKISLIVTTDVGPRIIFFSFVGEHNIFKEIKKDLGKKGGDSFRIYGGTRLWHAPESNPRTYYPDNEPVEYKWDGKSLILIQNIEKNTGIQKKMIIRMGPKSNQINIIYRLYNRNLWDIELAPWALSVMENGGICIIPQELFKTWEENFHPVRPLVLWSYTTMDDDRWNWGKKYITLSQDPSAMSRQKIGILNTWGWVAYYLKGNIFIKRYSYFPKRKYPDFGVNTEVYTDSNILEIETLGPLAKLAPEGFSEHSEDLFLFKSNMIEDEESIDENVLPLVKNLTGIDKY